MATLSSILGTDFLGYTGSQGVIGYTGSQGVIGYTGSQGVIGYTGSQGVIGYTGSRGFTGSQGVIGYTGSQGVIGYTGSRGFTGSQGVIGYTGSAPTLVEVIANNTTDETVYLTFVDGATGQQELETDTGLTYNPNTNIISSTASQAQYADLAEYFLADNVYPAGTVLMIGGAKEVTAANKLTRNIVGIVSEKPAYIMNNKLTGEYKTMVGYVGRVPVRVNGIVHKGDWLVVGDIPGVAIATTPDNVKLGQLVGKALDNHDTLFEGLVEVLIGRI